MVRSTGTETGGGAEVTARLAAPQDAGAVRELLEMNGAPVSPETPGGFLVAERGGEVLAALGYRVEGARLALGSFAAYPWAEERPLARVLYAEAHALARAAGLREARARPVRGDYPHEVGYRPSAEGWYLEAGLPFALREGLPERGWRRWLALWGATAVPFHGAFRP